MTRKLRCAAALAVALAVVPVPGLLAAPVQDPAATDATLVLSGQTPAVDPGGVFELVVRATGLQPGADLDITVHDRVRSRSELAASAAGDRLRARLRSDTRELDALPADAAGGRRAAIDLADAATGGAVTVPGVYPVEVTVRDDSGDTSDLVTHLVVRPPAGSTSPPLAVAPLALIDELDLDAAQLAAATALVDATNEAAGVPVTLAVRPELLEPLVDASADSAAAALLAALRTASSAATGPAWLALPYADVSPDALAAAGIPEELLHQIGHGSAVLRDVLGTAPTETTWLAAPDLGAEGFAMLPSHGVQHVVVDPDQVQPVADGVLSVARPFRLMAPRGDRTDRREDPPPVDAMVLDARLGAVLEADEEPALVASRVLAELASLWFEQERVPRGIVLPLDLDLDAEVVRAVLDGLRSSTLFEAVPLDDVFTAADPLTARGGDPLERSLQPDERSRLASALADDVRGARAVRESLRTMVGSSAPILDDVDRHLLRATSSRREPSERRAELGDALAEVDEFTGAISTPGAATITLTAREGTVPLTIRNDSGLPVDVRVRLRSPKLELLDLPDGDTLTMRLESTTTRRDIAVRTRASGAFPFEVEVTSPDGRLPVATARFSVRSTAVSGVGLVLSAGAGLFLVIWWARHWRQARRSAKLVDAPHPGQGPPSA